MKSLFIVLLSLVVTFVSCSGYSDQTILYEDFSSDLSSSLWTDQSSTGTQYSVEDGVLKAEWDVNESGTGYLKYDSILNLPESYIISFSAKMVESGNTGWGTGSDHMGIHLFDLSENRIFGTSWRQNEYNDFPFWYDNTETGLVGTGRYNFDETEWHTVTIIKEEGNISAYINEYCAYQISLSQFSAPTPAYFAIFVSDGTFLIDNISITTSGSAEVPEPSTGIIILLGLCFVVLRKKRARKILR